MKKLRFDVRAGTSKGDLKVRAFGVRFGYWPCLQAPFIEVAFNTRRYGLWYGLPTDSLPATA